MQILAATRLVLLVAAVGASVHGRNSGGCNANNCARAVTGTNAAKAPRITSRKQDCSSFMLVTVTPAPSTTTVTETAISGTTTVVVTTTVRPGILPRQGSQGAVTVRPTNIPPYASPCPNSSAYSSACSCWGIGPATTTAPAPVVTTTTTVTAVATAVVVVDECNALPAIGCNTIINTNCRSGTGSCACITDAQGTTFCARASGNCNLDRACSVNSDCAPGRRCTSACCGFNLCMQNTVGDCYSTPSALRLAASEGHALNGPSELVPATAGSI